MNIYERSHSVPNLIVAIVPFANPSVVFIDLALDFRFISKRWPGP